ncbi:24160_t:CDS:2, partial [Cetraspora pellucida]
YHEEEYEPNDDESLSGEEVEYEYNYKNREPNNNSDDDIVTNLRNENFIPKTSNLSSLETSIAKNVLEIRKENYCTIYNQLCLNKDEAKKIILKLLS